MRAYRGAAVSCEIQQDSTDVVSQLDAMLLWALICVVLSSVLYQP